MSSFQANYVAYRELRDLYGNAQAVVLPLRNSLHPGGINTLLEASVHRGRGSGERIGRHH